MRDELAGKIALVTGASRGIGRAIAVGLGRAGAGIAVNFLSHAAEAKAVCAEIEAAGRRAVISPARPSMSTAVGT